MKVVYLFCISLLLFVACSEKEDDFSAEKWKIQALEVEVHELDHQNEELTKVLVKMHSDHFSLRPMTTELIETLEQIKNQIRNMAEGIIQKETSALYQSVSKKTYPPTITFKNKEVPKALSELVKYCIEKYDTHPKTDGHLQESIDTMLSQSFSDHRLSNNTLFLDLSLAGSIELLEMLQIRILLEENKYLISQFDHAMNRFIIENYKSSGN